MSSSTSSIRSRSCSSSDVQAHTPRPRGSRARPSDQSATTRLGRAVSSDAHTWRTRPATRSQYGAVHPPSYAPRRREFTATDPFANLTLLGLHGSENVPAGMFPVNPPSLPSIDQVTACSAGSTFSPKSRTLASAWSIGMPPKRKMNTNSCASVISCARSTFSMHCSGVPSACAMRVVS
jgi:hypothetical protein